MAKGGWFILKKIFEKIEKNIDAIVKRKSKVDNELWNSFIQEHPTDIAIFISSLTKKNFATLFSCLPENLRLEVFDELSPFKKAHTLSLLSKEEVAFILKNSTIDDLSNTLDLLSDDDLKKYLELLQIEDREKVLSLLKFSSDSAAGIMNTQVVSLTQDLTVEKSLALFRRLKPQKEFHQQIFITDNEYKLVGYINLEDLVLSDFDQSIKSLMKKNRFIAKATQEKSSIANEARKYHLSSIPVVGEDNFFLGAISSLKIMHILEEEISDDVYKMSALAPIKSRTYFEISFFRLVYERSYILIILLLAQSFSTLLLEHFEGMLAGFLFYFVTMLTSTGGNASSQTSAIAIQGLASGEINRNNISRFIKRECLMALTIAFAVGITSFIRAYYFASQQSFSGSFIVGITIFVIVLVATLLGFLFPIALRRINIDPAFSAGPFLTTLMDILGLIIYCYIGKLIFSYFPI